MLDKLNNISVGIYIHLIIGIVLSQLTVAALVTSLGLSKLVSIIISFVFSTGIMFCKEYFWNLKLQKGNYNLNKFWAALIGILYGVLVFLY
jgi:hypothetical protein